MRWRVAGQDGWAFGEILAFLFVPVLLFASAEWLFPPRGQPVALDTYFIDHRRVFFLLQGLVSFGMGIGPTVFLGGTGSTLADFGSLTFIPIAFLLAWSSNRAVHFVGALLALGPILFVTLWMEIVRLG